MNVNINYQKLNSDILHIAVHTRTQELTAYVSQQVKNVVQDGPFKGMILPEAYSWGNGDILPKLLGTYEQELHPAIEKAISRNPEVVFNVGCAEGYYAVGLARRMPDIPVYAFDTDIKARGICHDAGSINYVGRLIVKDEFSDSYMHMSTPLREFRPSLVVMDVEGKECELLSPVDGFKHADIIVECHDYVDPNITTMLYKRFCETHDIEIITEGPRDPSSIKLLQSLHSLDRLFCVSENRPCKMNWLAMWSRERQTP